jgi:hypothetical protein
VSSWRITEEIPGALRAAYWTDRGRAIGVLCRQEKSPFGGTIVVVYTPELEPFPAFIPAFACDDCLGSGVARSEVIGRARRIASELTGMELRDSGIWSKKEIVAPRAASQPPQKAKGPGIFGRRSR